MKNIMSQSGERSTLCNATLYEARPSNDVECRFLVTDKTTKELSALPQLTLENGKIDGSRPLPSTPHHQHTWLTILNSLRLKLGQPDIRDKPRQQPILSAIKSRYDATPVLKIIQGVKDNKSTRIDSAATDFITDQSG